MRHSHYIELATPRKIRASDHPEAPTIEAPILKILRVDGPDELSEYGHILITFGYGFISSTGQFVLLDYQLTSEFIADVPEAPAENEEQKAKGLGQNPMTHHWEKAGNWFSRITQPLNGQTNRVAGDFRQRDLYEHLIDKLEIDGTIQEDQRNSSTEIP